MEYNRDALIALFEKTLLGFGYQTPDDSESLGTLHIKNEDFKLLPSLDDKSLIVAATYAWTFDSYDFEDMPADDPDNNIEFEVDDEEQIIRFIASVSFDDFNEDNVISQVGGSANAISTAYCSCCKNAEYEKWRNNYAFMPVTFSEFDCPVCGNHISYTPGTCPNCGKEYDANSEDIECEECGSILDEIICPKCGGRIREWDIEWYIQLSDTERE